MSDATFEPVELPSHYAKALVALVTAALAVLVTAITDNVITPAEAVNVALAVVTAAGVYLVPNLPAGVGKYAKALVAVGGTALQAAVPLVTEGTINASGWLMIALAALGALSVGIVPNVGYQPKRAVEA